MTRFCFPFLLLMVYSFLGWCGEMIYCSIGQRRLCEKRGFLNGPLCPIYGHGALIVLYCLHGGCANPIFTFFLGAILTSIVEYITSFVMEKLFHMRWWDYSRYKFHINGRVCLLNSTLFGLASVILCHAANPPIAAWLTNLFTSGAGIPISLILLAVYLMDVILSVRSAIRISAHLAKLHAVQAELAEKLEALKAEHQQNLEAGRQRMEQRKAAFLQTAEQRGDELAARLESAKEEARQKLRVLCDRPDFFDRRLLQSFPTLRSIHHPDALKKLKEHLENRKK